MAECLTQKRKELLLSSIKEESIKKIVEEVPVCPEKVVREPSEYQVFMRDCLRQKRLSSGTTKTKSMEQCAEEWNWKIYRRNRALQKPL